MMERSEWLRRKREEQGRERPADVRDISPSIRDFDHAVKTFREALSVVVEVAHATPEEGPLPTADLVALAQVAERVEASAIAVATDPIACGGTRGMEELAEIASRVSGPVLRRDLLLSVNQIYRSRQHGADAVLLSAWALSAPEQKLLREVAESTHMCAPVEATNAEELKAALAAGARLIVFPAFAPRGGLDLITALALAQQCPKALTTLVRGPFAAPEELEPLRGKVDGVWIAGPAARAEDPEHFLRSFIEVAENG